MSFSVTEKGFWKLNFGIGGRKPTDITLVQNPPDRGILNQGVMSGGFTSANPEI